jgi:hypothetical protein
MSRIAEVLAALRLEREQHLNEVSRLDRWIAAIEDVAGASPAQRAAALQSAAAHYPEDVLGRRPGPYSMLSVCEAAAIYLAETGEAKTTGQIAAALKAGGVRTTAKRFTDTVQKALRASASHYGIRHSADRKRWFVPR